MGGSVAEERAAGLLENRYEKIPDVQQALDVAWQSSPVSAIASWKSPVLLIHGDDDRNVRFSQTTDLVRRLEKAGFEVTALLGDYRGGPWDPRADVWVILARNPL